MQIANPENMRIAISIAGGKYFNDLEIPAALIPLAKHKYKNTKIDPTEHFMDKC